MYLPRGRADFPYIVYISPDIYNIYALICQILIQCPGVDIRQDVGVELDAVGTRYVEDVAVLDFDVLCEVVLDGVGFHIEGAVVHGAVDDAHNLDAGAAAFAGPAAGGRERGVGVHVVDGHVLDAGLVDLAHDVDLARAVARDDEREVRDAQVLGQGIHEDGLGFVKGQAFHLDAADVGQLHVAVKADGDAVDADAIGEADGEDAHRIAAEQAVVRRHGRMAKRRRLEHFLGFDIVLAGRILGGCLRWRLGGGCCRIRLCPHAHVRSNECLVGCLSLTAAHSCARRQCGIGFCQGCRGGLRCHIGGGRRGKDSAAREEQGRECECRR